ncbi:MAG: glycerol kinase GlpK [Gammaproteobacteria bacterium]
MHSEKHYIIAIDQGTSSSRCIIYNRQARPVASSQLEFTQYFPEPGWVEHDAEEIWRTQLNVLQQAMSQRRLQPSDIAGIGITNQRETVVVWDRQSGKPIHNAIVWQDRRTANACNRMIDEGLEPMIKAKTGLLIDPYFSATKIGWILDHVEGAREKAARGELAFGTIDSWLVWNLTQGALHITDAGNAARTLLYNIESLQWDDELLNLFGIPAPLLPEVKTTAEIYGMTRLPELGAGIPIAAIAGDQQAALFGQMCIEAGMAKCTYGTGSFLVMNTGGRMIASRHRLLTTIAWQIGGEVTYALEGSIFTSGSVIQWLRDGLKLFSQSEDCEALAAGVDDNGGVYFVPALTGLGAPHWDSSARGALFGITRGTTRSHIARAALESICFQVRDLLHAFSLDSGRAITELRIDGGAAQNDLLAQLQANIASIDVIRPIHPETTALGCAYFAGIATGVWTLQELKEKWQIDRIFHGTLTDREVEKLTRNWLKAVERAKHWDEPENEQ